MTLTEPTARIPVLHTVDVAVIGASTAAVAAALEARAAGKRVLAASDLSYFGEECAGTLRVWPEVDSGDPLFRQMYSGGSEGPVFPTHLKRTLEDALLNADIPFFFNVRPVALALCGDDGGGVLVLASRTSLYGVRFGAVVDATRQGLIGRLAGLAMKQSCPLPPELRWLVLSHDEGALESGEGFSIRDTGRVFPTGAGRKGDKPAWVHEITFERPTGDGSWEQLSAVEHRLRSRVLHERIRYTAEIIPDIASFHLVTDDGDLRDRVEGLADSDLRPLPWLYFSNGCLPLETAAAKTLEESAVLIDLGRRVGALAATGAADPAGEVGEWHTGGNDAVGTIRFCEPRLRGDQSREWIDFTWDSAASLEPREVVVAGGGTGGAPAGIAAAREGARTLVLEALHGMGGVGTLGQIASYWYGNRVGFTASLDADLAGYLSDERDREKTNRWYPEMKSAWYQRALIEAGGEVWLGSFAFGVRTKEGRVAGVLVSTPFGSGYVPASSVVDATGNSDIAAAAGAPCRVIGEDHVAVQGTGLSPRMADRSFNCDHSFIDDNDLVGVTHSFVNARAKFKHWFDVAPIVNSRERRQIVGEVELLPLDFLAKRTFPDTITTASSNFDTHGFTVHPVFMVMPPDHDALFAHVPFRCLLPRELEGVLVTGLGMSAHRDAIPVVRMQADTQNHGYAAGLAAALSSKQGLPLRELDIRDLQRRLVKLGILEAEVLEHGDSFPLPAEVVAQAAEEGPVNLFNTAVLFAHPEAAIPRLRKSLEQEKDAELREAKALALGLLGDPGAGPVLAEIIAGRDWDEGWNYRGMGQFGMSMSRLDALMVALGRTGHEPGIEVIKAKILALDETAAFSHCRAVAVAAGDFGAREFVEPLARLLELPGVAGHAHLDTREVIAQVNSELNETEARNLSLRELHLARGLYLCGDKADKLGQRTLEAYARDLRGHYAAHAAGVLRLRPGESRGRII